MHADPTGPVDEPGARGRSAVPVESGGDPQQQEQDDERATAGEVRAEAFVVAAVLALGGEGGQLGSGAGRLIVGRTNPEVVRAVGG